MDKIVDGNGIPPLMQALAESVQEVQREAARALGNLAANIVYGDMILRAGAQPHLLTLMRSENELCQRMAAMALCNLSSNIRNQKKMIADNILEPVQVRRVCCGG